MWHGRLGVTQRKSLRMLDRFRHLNRVRRRLDLAGCQLEGLRAMKTLFSGAGRALCSVMLAAVLACGVAGCGPQGPGGSGVTGTPKQNRDSTEGGKMTPREQRDVLVKFAWDTTERLSLSGWHPRNVAWAQECGEGGAAYAYDLWVPAGSDVIGDARKVQAYWESLGMSVRMVNGTTTPTLFAEGGPVLRASFDTDDVGGSYHVGGIAPCRPGDAYELNEQDNADRVAGKILPGDEGVEVLPPGSIPSPTESTTP